MACVSIHVGEFSIPAAVLEDNQSKREVLVGRGGPALDALLVLNMIHIYKNLSTHKCPKTRGSGKVDIGKWGER